MKTIRIDLVTLIAIIMIIISLFVIVVAYYNHEHRECIRDPVEYANDNSREYLWDSVVPVSFGDV